MSDTQSSIQREIKQTRPFRSKRQEAVVALLRTHSVVQRKYDGLTQRFGITSQQYNVLRILRGAKEALPTMEIAERMVEHTPGVTRIVDRLEKRGYTRRVRSAADRRQVLCEITPDGLAKLTEMDVVIDEFDDDVAAELSESQLDEFLEMLAAIRKRCAPI